MPVSTLRCTSIGPARDPGAHQPRERRDLPRVVHDRNEAARDDFLVSFAVVAAHHEDRRDDAGLAQLDALFEERHAEAVDPRSRSSVRATAGAPCP